MTFTDSVVSTVRKFYCNTLSRADGFYGWLADRNVPGRVFDLPIDGIRSGINAQSSLFCDRPPAPIASPKANISGGFCPGVLYELTIWYYPDGSGAVKNDGSPVTYDTRGDQTHQGDFYGPFSDIERYTDGFGNPALRVYGRRNPTSSGWDSRPVLRDTIPRFNGLAWQLDIQRSDGLPDDCDRGTGAPPYSPPPGTATPHSDVITYEGDDIDVDISVGAPYLDINADLTIPINLVNNNLDFDLNAEINLGNGDINFNFGNGNGECPACKTPTVEGDPPPDLPEVPEEEEEEENEEQQIIGVVVSSRIAENMIRATTIAQPSAPTLYNPRLGNLYFRVRFGRITAWTREYAIKNRLQYIEAPAGTISVAVAESEGVESDISYIRRKKS